VKFIVALALGGGGVRGLANIGVIRALHEGGIVADVIAGTSMGAIVGALYADSGNIDLTEQTIKRLLNSEEFLQKAHRIPGSTDMERGFLDKIYDTAIKGYFFYRFLFTESVVSAEAFFSELDRIIPEKPFSELKIPFACMALDLVSGYPEILHSGQVRLAVKASSAVPGILPPVQVDGRMCVDGGWVESVPISAAKVLGARFVIGVDVSRDISPIEYREEMKNSMDILFRAGDITRSLMNTLRIRDADFVIHPSVGDAEWSDFENIGMYISSGYSAGIKAVPSLRRALRVAKIKAFLWKKR
jgi:NTE family protein